MTKPIHQPSTILTVGIAASAGGLAAMSTFLKELPADIPAIYILAQHLSPTHRSHLSELLSRQTSIIVENLEDETTPKPGTLYITPPNADSVLEDGVLRLRKPSQTLGSPKPSADRLLKSIALGERERSVGIVLSGTGSDGSYGVQQIREVGGITIVQKPETADYDGMPLAAVQTGCVDLILEPQAIGEHLHRIAEALHAPIGKAPKTGEHSTLDEIFTQLEHETGIDFREYKESTIFRRIDRRIRALGIKDYTAYAEYLKSNTREVSALQKDLTISVTEFFRDPDHFEQLKHCVTKIISETTDRQVRVWVVGCATGEEAYSLAILFSEALGGLENFLKTRILILATDVDAKALETARRGIYPNSALNAIPSEIRDKYFRIGEAEAMVHPILRAAIVFSLHNVFADPPFLKVDLISARNVLIYFKSNVKHRVMQRFHYALRSTGYLFLGTSETLADAQTEFEKSAYGERIFAPRVLGKRPAIFDFEMQPMRFIAPAKPRVAKPARDTQQQDETFEALVRGMSPNAFITTAAGAIVRVFGDITAVAQISEKTLFNFNIQLLKTPFYEEALSLSAVALRNANERIGSWQENEEGKTKTRLRCIPIISSDSGEAHVLFVIETRDASQDNSDLEDMSEAERLSHLREMEAEMLRNREVLQQTLDELQTSNEELQSMNEELQSTGEEMQATNEQLQTSNEELQSANEELITVNDEMHLNSNTLHRVSEDLARTMDALPMVFLMVDHMLMITQASHLASDLFDLPGLIPDAVALSRCKIPKGFPKLVPLVEDAIQKQAVHESVIETNDAKYYFRVLPYTLEDSVGQYAMVSAVPLPKS